MNTLMAYYLDGQKYWGALLHEMMSIKGEPDIGHAMVILSSNCLKKLKQIKD
jgi:hypothetical protein